MTTTEALAVTAKTFKTIAEGLVCWASESAMVARLLKRFIDTMLVFQVGLRRTQLEIVLMRRWCVPNDIAYWLSYQWPRRWLPKLRPELWEGSPRD